MECVKRRMEIGGRKEERRERKLILAEIISIIDICFDEWRGAQKP